MTVNELVLLIATVCNIQGPQSRDAKIDCFEHFTNCMVKTAGKIEQSDFAQCSDKWKVINEKVK